MVSLLQKKENKHENVIQLLKKDIKYLYQNLTKEISNLKMLNLKEIKYQRAKLHFSLLKFEEWHSNL